MKRFLALALCAVALTAFLSQSARAAVDLSLNIEYFDPFNPSAGGNWTLVAKTDTPGSQGITAITVRLANLDASGSESVHPLIGHDINGGVLKTGVFGGQVEYVYGQDPGIGSPALILGVGRPTGPSNLVNDPLGDNVNWANSSVIATGTVPTFATLPNFTVAAANELIGGSTVAGTVDLRVVRVFTIPEPTTLLLGACAAGSIALCRRR